MGVQESGAKDCGWRGFGWRAATAGAALRGVPVVAALLILAGCGSGAGPVATLDDVDLAADAPRLEMRPAGPEVAGDVEADAASDPAPGAARGGAGNGAGGVLGWLQRSLRAGERTGAAGAGSDGDAAQADDDQDHDPEQVAGDLPFGVVARVCDLGPRAMGRRVASYPETGSRYVLRDTDPGAAGARDFYLTGFADGCARRFSGALAMFAGPAMHEQLRYGPAAAAIPESETDLAYKALKSRLCDVARDQPCGARLHRLEPDTAFVTVYARFGDTGRWANLLLHDGKLLAQSVQER